jgi:dTDP-4-dehydrorhamnose reductase
MPEETVCWLITGGTGQVGLALQRLPLGGVRLIAPGRDLLDLADLSGLDSLVAQHGVSGIINCSAYTAVDKAESEPDLAHAINAVAPGRLAKAAARAGIPIVHLSTDYVFAADGTGPWREDDPIAPASVYGRSKAAGEVAVRTSGARHAIIRTAWVVSADGHNFVKTMLRLGSEREELRVVADQIGTPTSAHDLAQALATIMTELSVDRVRSSGTWHCTNAGEASWYGLATQIFASAARRGMKVPSRVQAITTAEYPTPARRPADSRLSTSAIARDFGIVLRPWQDAIDDIVGLLANKSRDT